LLWFLFRRLVKQQKELFKMRKLRIYTDCGEKPNQPVNVALQTVLTVLLAEAEVVADFQEADLIIIDKVKN